MEFSVTKDDLIDAALSIASSDFCAEEFDMFDGINPEEAEKYQPLPINFEDSVFQVKTDPALLRAQQQYEQLRTSSANRGLRRQAPKNDDEDYTDDESFKTPKAGDRMLSSDGRRHSNGSDSTASSSPRASTGRKKSSAYRGVSFNVKSQKWKSVITVNKVQKFLGYFETEEEAARKYDEASKLHRGPNARLNFPSDGRPPICARKTSRTRTRQVRSQVVPLNSLNLSVDVDQKKSSEEGDTREVFSPMSLSGFLGSLASPLASPLTSPSFGKNYNITAFGDSLFSFPDAKSRSKPRLELEIPSKTKQHDRDDADDDEEGLSSPKKKHRPSIDATLSPSLNHNTAPPFDLQRFKEKGDECMTPTTFDLVMRSRAHLSLNIENS